MRTKSPQDRIGLQKMSTKSIYDLLLVKKLKTDLDMILAENS